MALQWDLTQCANAEALQCDEAWPTTQAVIFATMHVGIGHINNEATATEFWVRMLLLQRLYNTPPVPLPVLVQYVGLRTNVAKETWNQFTKRHLEGFRVDRLHDAQYALGHLDGNQCDPAVPTQAHAGGC